MSIRSIRPVSDGRAIVGSTASRVQFYPRGPRATAPDLGSRQRIGRQGSTVAGFLRAEEKRVRTSTMVKLLQAEAGRFPAMRIQDDLCRAALKIGRPDGLGRTGVAGALLDRVLLLVDDEVGQAPKDKIRVVVILSSERIALLTQSGS